jgi:imidazolonepropionase-like amidohydrolase
MGKSLVTLGLLVAALTITALVRRCPGPTGVSESPTVRAAVVRFDAGLAITDVTVIDGTGRPPQPGRTVVVRGGRIAAVRPADEVTLGPDVRVIAGRGRYLIPGLWDMHVHLTEPGALSLLTRHGVTGVRHMYSINPVFPGKLAFDPANPTHPRTVGSTHMLDGKGNPFRWPANTNVITVTDPAGAGKAVSEAIRLGNDQIKVYPMLTGPVYAAVVNAARERGLDVVGHLSKDVSAAEASDAGQRSIEHLDGLAIGFSKKPGRWTVMRIQAPIPGHGLDDLSGWRVQLAAHDDFDEQQAASLCETFVRNGTFHVPTLVQTRASGLLRDAAWDEGGLPPLLRVAWQRKRLPDGGVEIPALRIRMDAAELNDRARLFQKDLATVGRMRRAGVKLLAGTDTPYPGVLPGDALHTELELLVQAGLTPLEAIRAATVSAAECLRRADQVGSISEGLLADLVLLDRNPAGDIRHTRSVRTVLVGGREAWSADHTNPRGR